MNVLSSPALSIAVTWVTQDMDGILSRTTVTMIWRLHFDDWYVL